MHHRRLPAGRRRDSTCSGAGGSSQAGLRLLDDKRRTRAFRGAVRRGRQSDRESALHELSSSDPSADAGRRSPRARARDVRRAARSRSTRIAVRLMPRSDEHADASVINCQRPWQFAVEARPRVDGVAGQVPARDLSAGEGRRAERRAKPFEDS